MPDDIALKSHIEFLKGFGATTHTHSGNVLLNHLLGTYALLKTWGARPAVYMAGLFHSVYGTESYATACVPIDLRWQVSQQIGEEAENLVFLFGMKVGSAFCTLALQAAAIEGRASLRALPDCCAEPVYLLQHRLKEERLECSHQQMLDLIQLTVANEVEQSLRLPDLLDAKDRRFVLTLSSCLSPKAQAAVESLFGR